jgi:hypothetical protein
MNVPLAVKMTIQERRVERRQGQCRRMEDQMAATDRSIFFYRGLVVGCFSTLISGGVFIVIWRLLHG